MHHLPRKQHITILVTDSGLGGLSICADLINNLTRQGAAGELSVIYFNAWPRQDTGYNYLGTDQERIRVFGNALSAMNRYNPDLILIACNTLSVVFHQGGLADRVRAPVVDIINFGVDMIADRLNGRPDSTVLILGTRTTVSSCAHKRRLVERGVSDRRIVQQSCHGLAGAIERDPDSPEVKSLVDKFMAQAAAGIAPGTRHIYAALCCTHYGYCQAAIGKTLARHTGAEVDIVNPNQAMSDQVSLGQNSGRRPSVNFEVKVVSRVRLSPQKIDSIATRIETVSLHTAQALRNYIRLPDLFEV